jgi:hypothetical protein
MIPPVSGPPNSAFANLAAPLAQWNLAGRFFLGDPEHQAELENKCEQARATFVRDGKRIAAIEDASLKALADAEMAVRCLPQTDPGLSQHLREVLDEPFWLDDHSKYPHQTQSHVMISAMLIMPPADGPYGRLKTRLGAPLAQWKIVGDYNTPGECEQHRLALQKDSRSLPVSDAVGLKPLTDAERNARCIAPDDPRVKSALPWNGLFEPPMTDVPYPDYPDQNSVDYRATDYGNIGEASHAVKRWISQFPGPPNTARSPDGRYLMTNIDYPDEMSRVDDWHSIFLTDTRSGRKKLFYQYDRGIDIVWSAFSDMIALNDYYGSNVSQTLLLHLGSPAERIDLRERLGKSVRPRREKVSIETADHVYPRVVKWLDRDQLLFKVSGHDGVDAGGFTLAYLYNLKDDSFILLEYLHHKEDPP